MSKIVTSKSYVLFWTLHCQRRKLQSVLPQTQEDSVVCVLITTNKYLGNSRLKTVWPSWRSSLLTICPAFYFWKLHEACSHTHTHTHNGNAARQYVPVTIKSHWMSQTHAPLFQDNPIRCLFACHMQNHLMQPPVWTSPILSPAPTLRRTWGFFFSFLKESKSIALTIDFVMLDWSQLLSLVHTACVQQPWAVPFQHMTLWMWMGLKVRVSFPDGLRSAL